MTRASSRVSGLRDEVIQYSALWRYEAPWKSCQARLGLEVRVSAGVSFALVALLVGIDRRTIPRAPLEGGQAGRAHAPFLASAP